MQTMHLFAGVGGGLLADLILGHKPIVAVEWEPYACKVLRERSAEGWFPGLYVWEGDVRLFDPSEYAGRVGCVHAGFPCQDISVAGKQSGVGEGTRSGLYREVLRIAGIVRPRYLFLENVAAILSNGLGTVLGDLAAMGYDCQWLCIRASDVGAPHHRDRWFALAHRRGAGIHERRRPDGAWQNVRILGRNERDGVQGCTQKEGSILDNAYGAQRQGVQRQERIPTEYADTCGAGWWETEPGLGRVANGVSNRVGQLKGYGNAQVPMQAAVAYRLLGGE